MNIVKKIAKLLKLDEEGKLSKFFAKIEKRFKRDLEGIKHNLTALKFEYDRTIAGLQDQLEDAKAAVEESLLSVPMEALKDNNSMDQYADQYLEAIKKAENKVKTLELAIKEVEETFVKDSEALNKTASHIEAKLAQINKQYE